MKSNAIIFPLIFFLFFSGKEPETDFEYNYRKGHEALGKYNYAAALYYFDKASILSPKSDSVYSLMAYCYYSLGKPQDAIEWSNECLSLNPRNPYGYFMRGMSVAQVNLFQDTVFTDSIANLIKKHKKNEKWMKKNIRIHYYITEDARGFYDYGSAIADITKGIQLDSSQSLYYSHRAHLYNFLNMPEKAKPDYDRAIEADPDNAWLYLNRGIFNEKYRSPGSARDDYSRGIYRDSTIAELYERRGRLYRNFFYDKEYACKDFRKATLLGRHIEDMDEYCKLNWLDTLLHGQYSYPAWQHDYNPCYCPDFSKMFDPETDTIIEREILPGSGHKQTFIDIKESEKTTWQFEDGTEMVISKKTKERWLKEEEERKKKLPSP